MIFALWRQRAVGLGLLSLALCLVACSSAPSKPQAGALPAVTGGLTVTRAWSYTLGPTTGSLQPAVHGGRVVLASSQGLLAELDAESGKELWRLQLPSALSAGAGSDGRRHAVLTVHNELLVVQEGRELWRQRLAAPGYTPPLVAGERVFVQTADRGIQAFDGATGGRLWAVSRTTDPLVLKQSGLLAAVGNTLLAGHGGRLSALDPLTGQVRWEAVIGSSRGTNEVERLVDLVGGVSRQGEVVCVRAFQASVACVDALRGQILWSRAAQGHQGLDGDGSHVFGVESDSKLRAWSRQDGQLLWSQDQYRFRQLTAPRVWNAVLAVGDAQGQVHFLSRSSGQTLQRVGTDGTPVVQSPVIAGRTLVTVNRSGLVSGWRAD